jgi:cytochrome oxidase Cu insertion factor (SCO1/SenC/PrrC family)
VNVLLAAFFVWYTVSLSAQLPAAASAPPVGAPAPAFSLADHSGRAVSLGDLRGRNVLLVFYRGFW